MNFLCQGIQKLHPKQSDRETDTQTDKTETLPSRMCGRYQLKEAESWKAYGTANQSAEL